MQFMLVWHFMVTEFVLAMIDITYASTEANELCAKHMTCHKSAKNCILLTFILTKHISYNDCEFVNKIYMPFRE